LKTSLNISCDYTRHAKVMRI